MRIGNLAGRLVLIWDGHAVDVEQASSGQFNADPAAIYPRWSDFVAWAVELGDSAEDSFADRAVAFAEDQLLPPSPRPSQVFGIGLNYRDHAVEARLDLPNEPMVFTKFPSSLTGPVATVQLSSDRSDFEAELVVVISTSGHQVPLERGWDHVAGLTIGQDLSDRRVQFRDSPAQFSLGKSFPGYSPVGPYLVTADELPDRDDLAIGCEIDGEVMQSGRTSDMVFGVADLVSRLSQVVTLMPGDLIFTGTPAGVGAVRKPRRYLQPGEVITTSIEGLGSMRISLA